MTSHATIIAMNEIAHLGTKECQEWRRRIFSRHPWFTKTLANEYERIAEQQGYVHANLWLNRFEKRLKLGRTGLFVDCQDSQIKQYAEIKSKAVHLQIITLAQVLGKNSYEAIAQEMSKTIEKAGLEFPHDWNKEFTLKRALAAFARICDPQWWRRKLRVQASRQLEQLCRELGMVCKTRALYVSDYTLSRRTEQKKRNRSLLASLVAENVDTGYEASLADIADKSISNPQNRRSEVMVRMRGYEDLAKELGLQGVFFTLTCPGAYHAINHSGERNLKFNGTTPKQANEYLCLVWSRIRTHWQRLGIRCFGFRIAEPHHDGTPHWHLLLFFPPEDIEGATVTFREYALQRDPDEAGAQKYRCDAVLIDPEKGSATGYIAKYISKNIDGYGLENATSDESDASISSSTNRVEAWASTWGIRQFQQIGSTSVTVWRELRRVREPIEQAGLDELENIRAACDQGDWQMFVDLMGGPLAKRSDQTLRAFHVISDTESKYGEAASQLQGIIMRGANRYITRVHQWRIKRAEVDDVAEQFEMRRFYRGHGTRNDPRD